MSKIQQLKCIATGPSHHIKIPSNRIQQIGHYFPGCASHKGGLTGRKILETESKLKENEPGSTNISK